MRRCEDILVPELGRASHHVRFRRVKREGERRENIGHEVDPQDLERRKHAREPEQDREQHAQDLAEIAAQEVDDRLADVVEDPAPLPDGLDDRRKAVVLEDDVGGFPADLGSLDSHGDPDIRLLERDGVVDAVARHRRDLSGGLEHLHQPQLVFRRDPGQDGNGTGLFRRRRVELASVENDFASVADDSDLARDGPRGDDVVARHHDHPDAGVAALRYGPGDLRTRRIVDSREADEGERLPCRTEGERKGAHPPLRGRPHLRAPFVPDRFGHRRGVPLQQDERDVFEHALRRPLEADASVMPGDHPHR